MAEGSLSLVYKHILQISDHMSRWTFPFPVWVERRRRLAIKRFGGVKDEFAQQPEGHVTLSQGGAPQGHALPAGVIQQGGPSGSGYHSGQQHGGLHIHHHQGTGVYGEVVFGGSRLR